ncbi:SH3 domain-containing C40 family peptidase, partial [uncultured Duncaniella sp.]
MGTPMKVLEDNGSEWLKLEGPDGYTGYMNISSVKRLSDTEMQNWKNSSRLAVTSMSEVKVIRDTLISSPRNTVTELVNGSIVNGKKSRGRFSHVTLPDGRDGWVSTDCVSSIEDWASQPFEAQKILDRCYYLYGAPYLWGACSTKSVDCSGLVRVAYYGNGILTLRDARQQINIGRRIEPEDISSLRPADLLFFSATPDGRISHVALYDSEGKYIHSSGRVKCNYMRADDSDFSARVYRGASRIEGEISSEGIWQIINHPWYF